VTEVLIVRGHFVTPWELGPWRELDERFNVEYLLTGSNAFPVEGIGLAARRVGALRDRLPAGLLGDVAAKLVGDRYLRDADAAFARTDIVHAEDLSFWFAADAARRKTRHGFKLVQTVWETIPFLQTLRNREARRNRADVLSATDLFLPATERARQALLLEGVPDARMTVCPPGIDVERFRPPASRPAVSEHTILSPGRLVWEKGHHDVIRAVAALARGLVRPSAGSAGDVRLRIAGNGPEAPRLRAYADELGIGSLVTIGGLAYEEMPRAFATASAMVLASQSSVAGFFHPFDIPHAFWEEQFGLVLAEAMAARLAIVATTNGAIPEVLEGSVAELVAPGDWLGIARRLAAGPLSREPGARVKHPPELVERYSTTAAATRLTAAYDRVLAG
jgi:glycosyltransferase involved in cell wall biosynthesis